MAENSEIGRVASRVRLRGLRYWSFSNAPVRAGASAPDVEPQPGDTEAVTGAALPCEVMSDAANPMSVTTPSAPTIEPAAAPPVAAPQPSRTPVPVAAVPRASPPIVAPPDFTLLLAIWERRQNAVFAAPPAQEATTTFETLRAVVGAASPSG